MAHLIGVAVVLLAPGYVGYRLGLERGRQRGLREGEQLARIFSRFGRMF